MLELQVLAMIKVIKHNNDLVLPKSLKDLKRTSLQIERICDDDSISLVECLCQTCSGVHPIMNYELLMICVKCQSVGCKMSCGRCAECNVEVCNMCGEICGHDMHNQFVEENVVWCREHAPRCTQCEKTIHCNMCIENGIEVCQNCD
jgi:hypothetical protein